MLYSGHIVPSIIRFFLLLLHLSICSWRHLQYQSLILLQASSLNLKHLISCSILLLNLDIPMLFIFILYQSVIDSNESSF
ncbi:hypothetical protein HanXRQr2_Chr01g0025981 [Helianthus annuus]|uniref:Uncharacterized protein n=1 Tax=Helianthus annuus TaxID=4232 RepID=A0A251VNN0_HELAN|nr:hypothetical protein HanXRQr2_Chr01g0025981 [Helianthus annuus]KAJ0611872.1 hypothetical protein HanHA300_Chr01g0020761 [Helianthus annuus]KAJ0627231.1 hypothetical protein HanHA89_Chr01g0023001 [Helianthus annuus]KAJ0957253.1 hypothetical protein HanPSC8_Chr01g0025091 [Helianthus annuus]